MQRLNYHQCILALGLTLFTTPVVGAEFYDEQGKHHFVPETGFVPNAETAIKVAEAVWLPIYGEDVLKDERPFHAELMGDVWHVEGSLAGGEGVALGGVAEIEISKADGKILRVSHGE